MGDVRAETKPNAFASFGLINVPVGAHWARMLEIDFLDQKHIINAAKEYGKMPPDVLVKF